MSRNNTGNPIDSKAFPDFEDNVKNLDLAVNSDELRWSDRFGRDRKSFEGMEREFDADQAARDNAFESAQTYRENEFDSAQAYRESRFNDFIASSGYQFLGDYGPGIEFTEYNQLVRDENGEFWRLSGQVELPYTTTGAGIPEGDALVPAGDAVLRQDLANPDKGAAMVARGVVAVDSIADLLALPEDMRRGDLRYLVRGYHEGSDVGGGEFYFSPSQLKSGHNGGTIISPSVPFDSEGGVSDFLNGAGEIDPLGAGCYVREGDGTYYYPDEFGARFDNINDDTASVQACSDAAPTGSTVFYRYPQMKMQGKVSVTKGQTHRAIDTGLTISRISENSGESFFDVRDVSDIEFRNFKLYSNVVKFGPGYYVYTAGIYFWQCSNIQLTNIYATGAPSGIQIYDSNDATLTRCELTGNFLTGISAICNGLKIIDCYIHHNGDADPAVRGLTHDMYIANSSNGIVRGCIVGPCIDPDATVAAFARKVEIAEQETTNFPAEFSNWLFEDSVFQGHHGALNFNSTGTDADDTLERYPLENITVRNCRLDGLRVHYPLNFVSEGNEIGLLRIFKFSQHPELPSFESRRDVVERIDLGFYSNISSNPENAKRIVFDHATINNGSSEAITIFSGAHPAGLFIEPDVRGTGPVFSSAAETYYTRGNPSIFIVASLGMANYHLSSTVGPAAEQTGSVIAPNNSLPYADTVNILLLEDDKVDGGFVIDPPVMTPTSGATLKIILRSLSLPPTQVTWDPIYRLSPATAAGMDAVPRFHAIYMEFKSVNGKWIQCGDAHWAEVG